MDAHTLLLAIPVGIVGIGIGWWFRNHENSRVRASARGALVGGVVLLLGLLWQWVRG